jgi:membrane protease YdiL (CAAX protease family)
MKKLFAVLSSRLILFFIFQMTIALFLSSLGDSVKYWTLSATLTNVISIIILIILYKEENTSFFSLFRFQKEKIKTDLVWFIILVLISVPLAIVPSLALSNLLWGNTEYYHLILFQPVNKALLYFLLIAYPISTGLAELTTYFGYVMPRLKDHVKSQWLVIALPVIAFSVQHCTLPFLPEAKFILFRGLMYLLFSLVYGIAVYKRPSLLPWLAILQVLIYILPMTMLLSVKY